MNTAIRTNTSRVVSALVVAVLALTVVLLGGGKAGASPSARAATQAISDEDNAKAAAYWTPQRMKESRPAAMHSRGGGAGKAPAPEGPATVVTPGKPVKEAGSGAPDGQVQALNTMTASAASTSTSEGYWQGSNTAAPNRQIGRLFYQQWDPTYRVWRNYNCSGTVVNSENRSVVWTAGHCVFQTYSNTWNRNYVFCPGYRNGSCPLGQWTPYSQSTTTQWQNSVCTATGRCYNHEFNYDFGALKMNAINGYKIANWVGSHGISFNGPLYQYRYLFGYPLNKSNGQYLYYCYGSNSYSNGNLVISPCGAGGGASGGPWLSQINSSWGGVVHSVNSHGDGFMGGPYQGNVALGLFNSVRY